MEAAFRIRCLVESLDDDLDFMLSFDSVARTLNEIVTRARVEFDHSFGSHQPEARKYWTVPQEHLHEQLGHLIGLAFV
jgi:hypothetical protein